MKMMKDAMNVTPHAKLAMVLSSMTVYPVMRKLLNWRNSLFVSVYGDIPGILTLNYVFL